MRCFLLILATVALLSCPRSLNAVLATAPCEGRMQHLLTSPHTLIQPTANVCIDSLRTLLASTPSIPCMTYVNPIVQTTQRLQFADGGTSGRLKCDFTASHPLNLSNLNQSFVMDCEEIDTTGWTWLWWTLGILGGIGVVCLLYQAAVRGYEKLQHQRQREAQQAIDQVEAKSTGRRGKKGKKSAEAGTEAV